MQMRDMSLPAWTVLRAPSTSSAAPSEDELQSRASPDMLDEVAPTPPATQRAPVRKKQAGAVPIPRRAANGSAVAGGSNGATQSASAGPRKPPPPPPPPPPNRRPPPTSDSEEDVRPRKKKKRKIVDPEKGLATAGTRVSLASTLPTPATRPGPSSQAASASRPSVFAVPAPARDRRFRRVTLDGTPPASQTRTGPEADNGANRRSSAIGLSAPARHPPSQPPVSATDAPLNQVRARKKAGNAPGSAVIPRTNNPPTAGPSTQHAPPATAAPPTREIIEISDDDEPPPPPPPATAPAKSSKPPAPPPPQIPRRTRHRAPRPKPQAKFKETENGVLEILSDDDEPSAPTTTSSRPSAPGTAKLSSIPANLPPEPPPALSLVGSAVPALSAMETNPLPPEPALPAAIDTETPEQASSAELAPPPPEMPDVEMEEDHSPELPEPDLEDTPMDGIEEFINPSPEPYIAHPQDTEPAPETPGAVEEPRIPTPVADELPLPALMDKVDLQETHDLPPAGNAEGPSSRSPHAASRKSATPALQSEETARKEPVPDVQQILSPSPAVPVRDVPERPSRLPRGLPVLASASGIRSETVSPVSQILDPQLKDLAISTTAAERSGTPPASPKLPSKPRIKRSLFGGKDGFFKDAYRAQKKRHESGKASQTSSSPGSAVSGVRATASLSPTASRIGRTDTLPPSSLEHYQPDGSVAFSGQPSTLERTERQDSEVPQDEEGRQSVSPAAVDADKLDGPGAGSVTPSSTIPTDVPDRCISHPPEQEPPKLPVDVPQAVSPPAPLGAPVQATPIQPLAPAPSAAEEGSNHSAPAKSIDTPPDVDAPTTVGGDPSAEPRLRDTPPVEDQPDSQTLSQIIEHAVTANAHKEVIDLTFDDSDNEATQPASAGASKPVSRSQHDVPKGVSPTAPVSTSVIVPPATPASQPIRTLDLNAIRNIRKLSQASQQLSPTKFVTPVIPRNVRRTSAPSSLTATIPIVTPPAQVNAVASSSKLDTTPSITPSPSAATAQFTQRPMLPRLRDIMRGAFPAVTPPAPPAPAIPRVASPIVLSPATSRPPSPPAPSPSVIPEPAVRSVVGKAEHTRLSPTAAVDPEPHVASPPHSPSPEAMEEEECLSLIYPDSAERSPEAEMDEEMRELDQERDNVEEPEQPVILPRSRRTRSQVTSEASSIVSRPRRSARLTSSSATSSVEPPERPTSRTRRRQPYLRTASDDAVVAQGGISSSACSPFMKAFQDAGFESMSWKEDRKRIAKEFAPLTQFAKDIPHELHDRINALSLGARLAGNMQVLVFEAEIRANTADDEPYAPPVHIVNEVDDEPTPPLEFYYSNLMWHGEGVPKPDHDNLPGCDCIGPCDPASKTCACVKRQRDFKWDRGGFIYDKKGKLRATEYPIFECNMNCACSDECMNRVVQHGRQHELAICKTPNKGWGVFNGPKKISAHSYIGLYAGEYLTDSESEMRGILYNKFGRTYLFDLDFWFLKLDENGVEQEDSKVKYCIDAYHAGNFTRYLNHSCDPNCVIVACYINEGNLDKPLLTIFTCRDVEPFEELCFSYFGAPDDEMGVDAPPDEDQDDAVHVKCQCGAANCRGRMWK